MLKKYIKYEIKSLFPMILAGLCLMFLGTLLVESAQEFFYRDSSYSYYGPYNASNIESLTPFMMVIVLIFPIVMAVYRFTTESSDFYMQAPFSNRTVKRVKFLVGLCSVLAIISIGFWISSSIIIISHSLSPATIMEYDWYEDVEVACPKIDMNYIGFLWSYLILICFVIAHYSITTVFASLANNLLDAIILVLLFDAVIGSAYSGISEYICLYFPNKYELASELRYYKCFDFSVTSGFEIFKEISNLFLFGKGSYIGYKETDFDRLLNTYYLVSFILLVIFGAGAFVYTILRKEPSGEFSGKHGPRNDLISFLFNFGFFILSYSLLDLEIFSIGIYFTFNIMFVIFYFLIFILWNRGFKASKKSWMMFLTFETLIIISFVTAAIVNFDNIYTEKYYTGFFDF